MARYVTDISIDGQIEVEAENQEQARAHFRRVMGLLHGQTPRMTVVADTANYPVEILSAQPSIGMIATRTEEAA
jgi:hypothetical protein